MNTLAWFSFLKNFATYRETRLSHIAGKLRRRRMNRFVMIAAFLLLPSILSGKSPKFPGNPDRNLVLSIDYKFDYFGYAESNITDSYGTSSYQEADPRDYYLSISMLMPISNRISITWGGSFLHSDISWDPSPIVWKDKTEYQAWSLSVGVRFYLKGYYIDR
jgi:hypothetical protein